MKKILIADDEQFMRYLVTEALKNEHYHFFESKDGDSALQNALDIEPDLLILDVKMHGLDGFIVAKQYKLSGGKGIVMILSADPMITTKFEQNKEYVDYCILKPFDSDNFIALVDDVLNNRKS